MSPPTRLIRAAATLLALACCAREAAATRAGGRADSILAALEASDVALIGLVLEAHPSGTSERAEMRVLETLHGPAQPERIGMNTGPEALLEGDARLAPGETWLLLLARRGGQLEVPGGLRRASIRLRSESERSEARSLLNGYLAFLSGRDSTAFAALLRDNATIASPSLRSGVLEDLSQRLGAGDAPFLLALAGRRDAPEDSRVFAIVALGGLSAPLPTALQELLDPAQPTAIRRAVLDAHAARGALQVLERGLLDLDETVRAKAVDNLAGSEAVPVLERHFARESSRTVRLGIVRQLGLIGTEPARGALRRIAASSSDAALRGAAEKWLAAEP